MFHTRLANVPTMKPITKILGVGLHQISLMLIMAMLDQTGIIALAVCVISLNFDSD
jgi:hypothetical protein